MGNLREVSLPHWEPKKIKFRGTHEKLCHKPINVPSTVLADIKAMIKL